MAGGSAATDQAQGDMVRLPFMGSLVVNCSVVLAVLATSSIGIAEPGTTKRTAGNPSHVASRHLRTYRSRYGFEFKYPGALQLIIEGPDPYELRLRAGEPLSGTQEPLLDQIVLRRGTAEIVQIDVAHYPHLNPSYDEHGQRIEEWQWRPCGQDGFMRIETKASMRLAGRRAVHVVSVGESEDDMNQKTHFICVNDPRPLIISYADEMREQAEAILATLRFAK
jgi:hypothetical protein